MFRSLELLLSVFRATTEDQKAPINRGIPTRRNRGKSNAGHRATEGARSDNTPCENAPVPVAPSQKSTDLPSQNPAAHVCLSSQSTLQDCPGMAPTNRRRVPSNR